MLSSLIVEARLWRMAWGHRLADIRFRAAGNLMFMAMLGLPALGVAGIVCFARWSGAQLQARAQQQARAYALRRAEALRCLAENVYFEARGEPLEGQYAVAEVTLNRTRAPEFPNTVCGVVHERQWDPSRRRFVADFSWTEMHPEAPQEGPAWRQAMAVATAEYDDLHEPVVPDALFYHAAGVRPAWSRNRKVIAVIGNHIFYQ